MKFFILFIMIMSNCYASYENPFNYENTFEENDEELQFALRESLNISKGSPEKFPSSVESIINDENDEEFNLALLESLNLASQENSLKFPVKNLEIQGNIVSKIILLPGGLEITNSFMYNSAQTHKPLPSVCHINYYNSELCNGFPFIISGKMENNDYFQIVCQVKPPVDPQEGGLLIRPHYALHTSDKSPNYNVKYLCYDNNPSNQVTDLCSQNVSTHASGQDGSVASPNNMPTGIDINTSFSLIQTTVTGTNDFTGGDMTLKTYHILLNDMSEVYKLTSQMWGEIDLKWLLPEIQKHILQAGASQESITRFFNDINQDLEMVISQK